MPRVVDVEDADDFEWISQSVCLSVSGIYGSRQDNNDGSD